MQQLPNSQVVIGLVGALEVVTLGAFVYDMLPVVPDKMPEACLLVACLTAAIGFHIRSALSTTSSKLWLTAFEKFCGSMQYMGLAVWPWHVLQP